MTDPRLPRLAVPSAYRLELAPDLDAHTFTGTVEIDVEILEPTARLVLNSIELTIHSASVVWTWKIQLKGSTPWRCRPPELIDLW